MAVREFLQSMIDSIREKRSKEVTFTELKDLSKWPEIPLEVLKACNRSGIDRALLKEEVS